MCFLYDYIATLLYGFLFDSSFLRHGNAKRWRRRNDKSQYLTHCSITMLHLDFQIYILNLHNIYTTNQWRLQPGDNGARFPQNKHVPVSLYSDLIFCGRQEITKILISTSLWKPLVEFDNVYFRRSTCTEMTSFKARSLR